MLLLVFAHADEAAAFADLPHLVTGVGKINATLALTRALAGGGVDRVIVLGTAGLVAEGPTLDTLCQVTRAVQHDYSLPSPAIEPAGEVLLEETATIATGDVFVQDDAQREAIAALGATLVDMESYAYAAVCESFGVPLQLFKIPSDFADSSTTMAHWDGIVKTKSERLREFYDARLR